MQMDLKNYGEDITIDNVQHYCRHTKELKQTQVKKAMQFIRYDCMKYIGNKLDELNISDKMRDAFKGSKNVFLCLPLNTEDYFDFFGHLLQKRPFDKNYNKSEYIIWKRPDNTFECNCQGWQSKANKGETMIEGANCSHVLALFFAFKLKCFGRGN